MERRERVAEDAGGVRAVPWVGAALAGSVQVGIVLVGAVLAVLAASWISGVLGLQVSQLPRLVGLAYIAAVTFPLCVIDVRERRLPNVLVLPGYAVAGTGLVWDALARGHPVQAVAEVVLCAAGVLGVLLAVAAGGGIGMGDVKLAGLLILVLGGLGIGDGGADAAVGSATVGPIVPAVACMAAAFAAAGLVALRAPPLRAATDEGIPLGPYLLGSFWAVGAVVTFTATTA